MEKGEQPACQVVVCPRLLVTAPRCQCGVRLLGRSVWEGLRAQGEQSGDCNGLCGWLLNVRCSVIPWPPTARVCTPVTVQQPRTATETTTDDSKQQRCTKQEVELLRHSSRRYCLLLRILKVYRTSSPSGYIQYTSRGHYNSQR